MFYWTKPFRTVSSGLNILRYRDVEFPIHYENGKQALSLIKGQSRLTLN